MDSAEPSWWFGADKVWRKGHPPPGWWQGADGRWHPPDEETAVLPRLRVGAGHMRTRDRRAETDARGPGWTRFAVLGTVVALGLVVVVITALTAGMPSQEPPDGASSSGAGGTTGPGASGPDAATLEPAPADAIGDPTGSDLDGGNEPSGDAPGGGDGTSTGGARSGDAGVGDGGAARTTTTLAGDGDPGGRDGDCDGWAPPGRPDHDVAPDRRGPDCR